MRPVLVLLLLCPIGLKAQEIDKQKLLEMLRLPKSILGFGFEYNGDHTVPQLSGQAEWISVEIAKLKKTLKHEPSDWTIWKEIANKADHLQDFVQARKAVEEGFACIKAWLVQHPNDQQALLELTDVLLGLGRVDEAFANAQMFVSRYPTQASAWVKLGRCYGEKDSLGEFTNAFTKAISLSPNDPETHLEYASHLYDIIGKRVFGEDPMLSNNSLENLQRQIKDQNPATKSKDANAKEKSALIPASFLPAKKLTPTQASNLSEPNGENQSLKNFAKVREEAQLAVKLFRQQDPSNLKVLTALFLYHASEAFEHPLTSEMKSQEDLFKQADVLTELKRVAKLQPDDIALQFQLFLSKYFSAFQRRIQDHQATPEDQFNPTFRWKNVLKNDEWQEMESSLRLEDQLNNMPREQAVFAHHALRIMGFMLGELDFAIKHARCVCDLAPERAENWHTLVGLLIISGRPAEVFALQSNWLKYHPTAETHFLLAKAAEKVNDWKLVRHHVSEGLKLDPTHVKLLYSQVVADLKNDSSPAALKVAQDRLKNGAIQIVEKDKKRDERINDEDLCFILVVFYALTGELSNAQKEMEYGLHYYPQNPDFIKVRQIIGIAGLAPPTLGKP